MATQCAVSMIIIVFAVDVVVVVNKRHEHGYHCREGNVIWIFYLQVFKLWSIYRLNKTLD